MAVDGLGGTGEGAAAVAARVNATRAVQQRRDADDSSARQVAVAAQRERAAQADARKAADDEAVARRSDAADREARSRRDQDASSRLATRRTAFVAQSIAQRDDHPESASALNARRGAEAYARAAGPRVSESEHLDVFPPGEVMSAGGEHRVDLVL